MFALEVRPGCSRRWSTTLASRSAIAVASTASIRSPAGGAFAARGRRGDGQEEEQESGAQGEDAAPPHRPKCSSTAGATSRSVHCSRSSAAAGPAADEEQRAEAVVPVQGAVAAAAGMGDAAPVDRLVAGRQGDDEVAGVRRAQRGEDPGERVRILIAAQEAVLDRGEQDRRVAVEVPAAAAQVADPSLPRPLEAHVARRRPARPTRGPPGPPASRPGRRLRWPRAAAAPRPARPAHPRRAAGRRGRRGRSG